MKNNNIISFLKRLLPFISVRRRFQLVAVLILALLVSIAEVISIGAILPFLAVLSNPENVLQINFFEPLFRLLNIYTARDLIIPFALIFAVAICLTALLRLSFLWLSTKVSYMIGVDLSTTMYKITLYQPYESYFERNSSEIISTISSKSNAVTIVLGLAMNLCGSLVSLCSILIALLFISPIVSIGTFSGFAVIYFLIYLLTKNKLKNNGRLISHESNLVFKALQEGLSGIRNVLIDGTQETFYNIYYKADKTLKKAQGNNAFLSQFPRYGVEAGGMLLLVYVSTILMITNDGLLGTIPILGTLALGAQRFLPAFQQVYGSLSGIKGSLPSVEEAIHLLERPLPAFYYQKNTTPLKFEDSIKIANLYYQYKSNQKFVLSNISLLIEKGDRIGFIGETGSGKSTLIDIVMGLILPTSGSILVDDQTISEMNQRNWQMNISHVPQTIFLADASIKNNIAFGLHEDNIDLERVKWAIRIAQLDTVVDGMEHGYNTIVGERGIRLSGGQRQRIGIARALYKNANVIIFDEATSALDHKTEANLMSALESLGKHITILMIAHRLSTLKECTKIVELEFGRIKRICQYKDLT